MQALGVSDHVPLLLVLLPCFSQLHLGLTNLGHHELSQQTDLATWHRPSFSSLHPAHRPLGKVQEWADVPAA